jgi:signal recognition particle subunit SRP54
VPVFLLGDQMSPVAIAKAGLQHAKDNGHDYLIIDTAGRLHIDEELMDELINIRKEVSPDEILLVVDAMTGQDAVNVAESFHKQMELTGVILTKLDGDTRGGAALSVKAVTGCPIKFVATGEKVDALEPFHPDRMASRILGMGDMLSLIERAQENIDADKAKELELKMRNNEFTFEDFLEQLEQVKKLGPLDQLMDMMPGMNKIKGAKDLKVDDKQMARTVAIVKSMTIQEKRKPEILNASRRKRLALGSGTSVQEVNRLIKQFDDMRKMMKQFSGMMGSGGKGMKGLKGLKGKLGKGMKFPFG